MKKRTRLRGWMNEQQQEGCESNNPIFTHRLCPFLSVRWSSSQEVLFFGRRHRSTEEFEFCPSLLCWSMGRRIWLGSLPGWSSIKFVVLCFLTQRPISGSFCTSDICFAVASALFSQNPQSIRSVGSGEGGSGIVTAVVWGCTRDWGWYDRRLTCFNPLSALHFYLVR